MDELPVSRAHDLRARPPLATESNASSSFEEMPTVPRLDSYGPANRINPSG